MCLSLIPEESLGFDLRTGNGLYYLERPIDLSGRIEIWFMDLKACFFLFFFINFITRECSRWDEDPVSTQNSDDTVNTWSTGLSEN